MNAIIHFKISNFKLSKAPRLIYFSGSPKKSEIRSAVSSEMIDGLDAFFV
jgi:hypothetical protein